MLEPKKGAYMDEYITALDFASLYPSIIRSYNLCYTTFVNDAKYDNLAGVEYKEIVVGDKIYKFVQNRDGLLPLVLQDLASFRKAAKKQMAEAEARGDNFAVMLHNASQLSFKVRVSLQ